MKIFGSATLIIFVLVLAFNFVIGGWATQYVIETWGTVLKHHPVHASFMMSGLLGLLVGEIAVPVAIVTWVILLFC